MLTLTYEEYCKYFGNPDRHVVLSVVLEQQCDMEHWHTAASVCGIDFMDDSPEVEAGR